jgi:uncharacterized protein DUF5947
MSSAPLASLRRLTRNVPVGHRFVFHESASQQSVLCYPGPAGATESQLPPGARPPDLRPDAEAVLVHDGEHCLVPIDICYELVGRPRKAGRGFAGGSAARDETARFFTRVRERSAT